MLVYRIAKKQFINDLSGKGAELAGGRWNLKGLPAIYTSSSLALCICETLVHTDKDIPPVNMYFAEIEIPDEYISDEYFNQVSFEHSLNIGTNWIKEANSLAIKVPSALMPQAYIKDYNVIINPRHQDFSKIKILRTDEVLFDLRLIKD